MNRFFIGVAAAILAFSSMMQSQTRPRESLHGLDGVYVYAHPVAKEVEAGGLTTIQIKGAAQKQLRDAGISLQSEPQSTNGSATLAIIISTVKQPEGAYLFDVEVSLVQDVYLARHKDAAVFPSQTWSQKAIGITGANRMDLILEPLKVRVGDFINDYLSANA